MSIVLHIEYCTIEDSSNMMVLIHYDLDLGLARLITADWQFIMPLLSPTEFTLDFANGQINALTINFHIKMASLDIRPHLNWCLEGQYKQYSL